MGLNGGLHVSGDMFNRDNGVPITSCNLNQVVEFAWIVPACSYHADPNVRPTIIYNKDTILNFVLCYCAIPLLGRICPSNVLSADISVESSQ